MRFLLSVVTWLIFSLSTCAQTSSWLTLYERTSGTETPSYAETVRYCEQLAAASPAVTFLSFGKSSRGRELPLLILDRDGLSDPDSIHRTGRLVLMIQACIHPGESEGKDAGLMLFRDLTVNHTQRTVACAERWLDHISVVFVPIFNVDGHERFGPYNRINQNGPREMGWRVTATNLNLNRDYLKADSPEMRHWLSLFNHWLPDFCIDIHTTDGADYQYVLTYFMEIYGQMDPVLTKWSGEVFLPAMTASMEGKGYPVFPYITFRNWHDPRSGLVTQVGLPMLFQAYTSLRNRPGLLIETHMLKPYPQRVEATYECLLVTMEILEKQHNALIESVKHADDFLSSDQFLQESFPLQFETRRDDSIMTAFKGFKYHERKSEISRGTWFDYTDTAETFSVPWFCFTLPKVSVTLPYAYIVPVEWKEIIERLKVHGIRMIQVPEDTIIPVSSYRFINPKWQVTPYEGRHPMTSIEYEEISEERLIPAGSVVIPTRQQAGRIIPCLLEPKGNGSLLYWGFFDAIFEQKEYAENYIMEKLAPRMLEEDTALRTAYEKRMVTDSVFSHDPRQILNWFYQQTPYADNRRMVYPVSRIMDETILRKIISSGR